MNSNLHDIVFSTFYGSIAGDALGVPYEFGWRGKFKAETMTGYGAHNQPAGSWSDDTSLTLCLIKNITEYGDSYDLMDKFSDWFEKGKYTPHGKAFDIGRTTQLAVLKYNMGVPPEMCGGTDENSNGNGSLMRIAPIAFTLRAVEDFGKRVQRVKACSRLTHGHPRTVLACVIYIETMIRLFDTDDLEGALQKASQTCLDNLKGTEYENEFQHYKRIFDGSIKDAPIDSIESNGYVVHTLEAALWSCFQNAGVKDVILTAVNLGRDADTVGSIAGSIAGMRCKDPAALPAEWLSVIARKKAIDKLLDDFCECLEMNY
ncbi:ADP-ribosylglycohydrolase family protein [Treponema parvum]|uniref:ADP-ribosylglycohydrolase family protein n=1 Tax=Treponema parvum TaxID=138851 RepID=UPI001AEC26B1|nr:ADP-ribosylglycohydrolase family protein [Treponema parvum]QTQ15715.1 ADP-ribosylglycohydrolase family protein [Treponema parvum]